MPTSDFWAVGSWEAGGLYFLVIFKSGLLWGIGVHYFGLLGFPGSLKPLSPKFSADDQLMAAFKMEQLQEHIMES